jgi:hypothetical protein
MATPFVAACYALVRSQYSGLPVAEVISLPGSTSTPLPYVYDTSFLSTVAGQGAGLINPYKALTYKTAVSPSQLEIGDTNNFPNVPQTTTINNASPDSKTYTIKHQGAGYAEYFPYPDLLPPDYMITAVYLNNKFMPRFPLPLLPSRLLPVNLTTSMFPLRRSRLPKSSKRPFSQVLSRLPARMNHLPSLILVYLTLVERAMPST